MRQGVGPAAGWHDWLRPASRGAVSDRVFYCGSVESAQRFLIEKIGIGWCHGRVEETRFTRGGRGFRPNPVRPAGSGFQGALLARETLSQAGRSARMAGKSGVCMTDLSVHHALLHRHPDIGNGRYKGSFPRIRDRLVRPQHRTLTGARMSRRANEVESFNNCLVLTGNCGTGIRAIQQRSH